VDWVDELARRVRARLVWGLLAAIGVTVLALPATVLATLPADVAVVAGKPVSRQVFDHWTFVSAKSRALTVQERWRWRTAAGFVRSGLACWDWRNGPVILTACESSC